MPAHILEYLTKAAELHPDATAFNYCTAKSETSISNIDLLHATKSLAFELNKQYNPGDRILLIFPPGLEFIIALFACIYAGVIAVPVYPPDLRRKQHNLSMQRLIKIIENANPSAILCSKSMQLILGKGRLVNFIKKIASKLSIIKQQVDSSKLNSLKVLCYKKTTNNVNINLVYNQICYLQYTSGSTGTPKGVKITHSNIINNTQNILKGIQQSGKTIASAVHWLPLYHDMGLINSVFLPLALNIPSTITSPLEFLQNPIFWLELISKNKKVFSGGPNFSYALCVRKFKQSDKSIDLKNWEIAYTGAEKIRAKTFSDFCDKFSAYGFSYKSLSSCYGLAEATLYACGYPPGDGLITSSFLKNNNQFVESTDKRAIELTSIGQCFADHQLLIVDPETKLPLADGNLGELWLHGPSVANGYWRNPELTEKIFNAQAQGLKTAFLRTGDLGFIYKGNSYIYSRLKDILIFNGLSIAPEDIEWCLNACSFIRPGGIAAFSVDVDDSEKLIIAAELRDKKSASEEKIKTIRGIISRDCKIHAQEIILLATNSVPRTSSGKVQRKLCAEKFINNEFNVLLSG